MKTRFPAEGSLCRWCLAAVLGLCLVLLLGAAGSGKLPATEKELKAVFVYKFARFVEWPAASFTNASAPLVIGVVGTDPFGQLLESAVADETVAGRKLVVRRFGPGEDLRSAHLLFVSPSERERWPALLSTLSTNAVLTVGDFNRFAEQGGMIQFLKIKDTVRFTINQAAAARCGLTIRFQLLRLSQPAPSD